MSQVSHTATQVLTNIETAQRQNRLFDALKQGNAALKSLQQVRQLRSLSDIRTRPALQSTLLLFMTLIWHVGAHGNACRHMLNRLRL